MWKANPKINLDVFQCLLLLLEGSLRLRDSPDRAEAVEAEAARAGGAVSPGHVKANIVRSKVLRNEATNTMSII